MSAFKKLLSNTVNTFYAGKKLYTDISTTYNILITLKKSIDGFNTPHIITISSLDNKIINTAIRVNENINNLQNKKLGTILYKTITTKLKLQDDFIKSLLDTRNSMSAGSLITMKYKSRKNKIIIKNKAKTSKCNKKLFGGVDIKKQLLEFINGVISNLQFVGIDMSKQIILLCILLDNLNRYINIIDEDELNIIEKLIDRFSYNNEPKQILYLTDIDELCKFINILFNLSYEDFIYGDYNIIDIIVCTLQYFYINFKNFIKFIKDALEYKTVINYTVPLIKKSLLSYIISLLEPYKKSIFIEIILNALFNKSLTDITDYDSLNTFITEIYSFIEEKQNVFTLIIDIITRVYTFTFYGETNNDMTDNGMPNNVILTNIIEIINNILIDNEYINVNMPDNMDTIISNLSNCINNIKVGILKSLFTVKYTEEQKQFVLKFGIHGVERTISYDYKKMESFYKNKLQRGGGINIIKMEPPYILSDNDDIISYLSGRNNIYRLLNNFSVSSENMSLFSTCLNDLLGIYSINRVAIQDFVRYFAESSGRETITAEVKNNVILSIFETHKSLLSKVLFIAITIGKTISRIPGTFKQTKTKFAFISSYISPLLIVYVNIVSFFKLSYSKLENDGIDKLSGYFYRKLNMVLIMQIFKNLISTDTLKINTYDDILEMDQIALHNLFTIRPTDKITYKKRVEPMKNSIKTISIKINKTINLLELKIDEIDDYLHAIEVIITDITVNDIIGIKKYVLSHV
jgi:hypothetical protein